MLEVESSVPARQCPLHSTAWDLAWDTPARTETQIRTSQSDSHFFFSQPPSIPTTHLQSNGCDLGRDVRLRHTPPPHGSHGCDTPMPVGATPRPQHRQARRRDASLLTMPHPKGATRNAHRIPPMPRSMRPAGATATAIPSHPTGATPQRQWARCPNSHHAQGPVRRDAYCTSLPSHECDTSTLSTSTGATPQRLLRLPYLLSHLKGATPNAYCAPLPSLVRTPMPSARTSPLPPHGRAPHVYPI